MATGAFPISISATVDIGFGRGRLAPGPAASIARIDAQMMDAFGVRHDVNDAWRSPEQADRNRAAWVAYQNGTGPAAPYALDRWGSIHCRGYADDSDDWYHPGKAAILRRNGWRQTALYPVGDSRREEWHGEYDEDLDEFLGQTASISARPFEEPSPEEDDMKAIIQAGQPDSGIIIQAGVPPYSLGAQVFDALCGAYGLKAQTLADWQYATVVREQWTAAGAAAALEPRAGIPADDVKAIVDGLSAGIDEAIARGLGVDQILDRLATLPREVVDQLKARL